jgi:hypothetical protein
MDTNSELTSHKKVPRLLSEHLLAEHLLTEYLLTEHLAGSDTVECSLPLHVAKRCGRDGKADVYTIAVWVDAVLLPLCHAQPLDNAVASLRSVLEKIALPSECNVSTTP